jgi:hypothetical protein
MTEEVEAYLAMHTVGNSLGAAVGEEVDTAHLLTMRPWDRRSRDAEQGNEYDEARAEP